MGGGFLHDLASNGDYYGSRGVTTAKIWDSVRIRDTKALTVVIEIPKQFVLLEILARESVHLE